MNEENLEIFIKLDEIDLAGPNSVFITPVKLMKSHINDIPLGMPFLKAFISNPMSYIDI